MKLTDLKVFYDYLAIGIPIKEFGWTSSWDISGKMLIHSGRYEDVFLLPDGRHLPCGDLYVLVPSLKKPLHICRYRYLKDDKVMLTFVGSPGEGLHETTLKVSDVYVLDEKAYDPNE